jgi:uncharacterized protein YkwD
MFSSRRSRSRRANTFLNGTAGILTALSLAAPLQASHAAATPARKSVAVSQATELENPILVAVNRTRRAHGLRLLTEAPRLVNAARAHLRALALAGEFRHAWPDGRRFDLWIRGFYPVGSARSWAVGENLIWSSASLTPKDVVRAWLASPPHRRVLLAPYWRQLGIGAVRANRAGGVYGGADVMMAAAEFGARS